MFEDLSSDPNNQKEPTIIDKKIIASQVRTKESLNWRVANPINDKCHELINNSLINLITKKKTIAIKGPTGSIRGHKDCVKKNIDNILTTIVKKNSGTNNLNDISDDDCDICVAYVTSLGVVRKTYEDCRLLK